MDINFKETYKSLSTAELLNIVKQTNDYQPEAVLAAIALLKDRTITREDQTEAERIDAGKKESRIDTRQLVNILSAKIENLVEPIVRPDTKVNPQKWINILMVSLGIYTLWLLTQLFVRWLQLNRINHTEYFNKFEIIPPFYLLVTIGGLYKRKKWGWCLLMIFFVNETILFAYGTFLSIKYSWLRMHIAGSVAGTLIYAGAMHLLSRIQTRTYFNITDRFFRNTIFSAIIIFLLLQVFAEYL